MGSSGQHRGSCCIMAGYHLHKKCVCCYDKHLWTDPCIVDRTNFVHFCWISEQKADPFYTAI